MNRYPLRDLNSVDIRFTHPTLYRSVMTFAFISIGLGLNFIFTRPTFNAYEIPKIYPGLAFLILGLSKIIFLNVTRNLKFVRITMSVEIAFMLFWGVGTAITYFQGRTSLQLFVLYVGLSTFETFLLIEPFYNPMTERKATNESLG